MMGAEGYSFVFLVRDVGGRLGRPLAEIVACGRREGGTAGGSVQVRRTAPCCRMVGDIRVPDLVGWNGFLLVGGG